MGCTTKAADLQVGNELVTEVYVVWIAEMGCISG